MALPFVGNKLAASPIAPQPGADGAARQSLPKIRMPPAGEKYLQNVLPLLVWRMPMVPCMKNKAELVETKSPVPAMQDKQNEAAI